MQGLLIHRCLARRGCCHIRPLSTSSFKADDLKVNLTKKKLPKPSDVTAIKFGSVFTDHIMKMEWTKAGGWASPKIEPFGDLHMHPAAKVLHYSTTIFDGMKAFRGVDDRIRLFRPHLNVNRILSSSRRASLPLFDGDEYLKCVKKFVEIEQDWVPKASADTPASLYIRPTFIGTEPTLGVASSDTALLFTILSPVGPYYPTGMKPVSLFADPRNVRAWPGGCGAFKMGSNYAPTIAVGDEATAAGCQQVLWLLGDTHDITEVGSMNVFAYWINENGEEELITAPLDGTILPGVTRNSVLSLATEWGKLKVSEKPFNMSQLKAAIKENRLKEMFGCGTACVVCPIERILYQGENLHIPTMDKKAQLTMKVYDALLDIMYGRSNQKTEWAEFIN